jgi:Icc protein
VSWRFKPLKSSWPFVMVTSPDDRRLAIEPDSGEASIQQVRASAWGAVPIAQAEFRIDDQPWQPMYSGGGGLFGGELTAPDGPQGNRDIDTIEVAPNRETGQPTGSDAGSIGAWPERHLFGTQLGPNRNGRKW